MSRILPWVALLVISMAMVLDGCSNSPSSTAPISLSLSPSARATDQGRTVNVTASVANDPSSRGVTWSLTGPGSLSNAAALSVTYNPPTAALNRAQQVTITATAAADTTKMAAVQITVNPYLQIPFQTLANGFVGSPYAQMIALTGGTAPFQWSVYDGPVITGWQVGGSVPTGLTLNAATGTISGKPTGGGTWSFEATVTDAAGVTATNGFLSVQINSSTPQANAVPFVNQPLIPTSVSPGSAAFTLKLSGTQFVPGAAVNWNHAALPTTFLDSGHISTLIPATNVARAGTASVTVVNPSPGGGSSNTVYFQVGEPEATVSFANASNSPLQTPEPVALAVADFNEDGKPDLAIAENVRVSVLLGNGDGTLASASGSPLPVPSPPYDDFGSPYTGPLISGDFNNSGHLGLAIGLFQNEAAAVLFGDGSGAFTNSSTLANTLGQSTMSLSTADFNGDGNLDLVAVNNPSGISPVTLLGYGTGAFNAADQNIEIAGVSSAVGDFNGMENWMSRSTADRYCLATATGLSHRGLLQPPTVGSASRLPISMAMASSTWRFATAPVAP